MKHMTITSIRRKSFLDELVRLVDLLRGGREALLLLAAWFALGTVAFSQGIWMSAALPLAAAGLPTLLCAVARQTLDRRQGLRLARSEQALRRLQPAALAERLAW